MQFRPDIMLRFPASTLLVRQCLVAIDARHLRHAPRSLWFLKWEWGSNSVRTPSMGTHAADRGTAKSSFIGSCRQQARGIPTKSQTRQRCGKQGARPRTKARPPLSQDKRSELSSEFLGRCSKYPHPRKCPSSRADSPMKTLKCH